MRTLRTLLIAPLVLTLTMSSSAFAQDRHAVDPSAISQAVASEVARQDADRAAIHQALARPEVRDLAAKSGINLDRVGAQVDTLNGSSLSQVAAAAQQVNQTLVGGASTVVISTTTIIIALLIVLILVVAVD